MKKLLLLIVFAFILQLRSGQQIIIHEAVGFFIKDDQTIFFNLQQTKVFPIPTNMIEYCVYVPDDKLS